MSRVLLLNATYEPIQVITLKRAVGLLVAEKAELVDQREGRINSASLSMPHPSVIRLKYYVKVPYRGTLPLTRKTLMHRDSGMCQYCGKRGDTIDHVIPRSKGGKHTWNNVVIACRPCNAKKSDKLLGELGWRINREPVAPRGTYWIVLGITDPEWEPYLGAAGASA